ncbi:tryptophan--tRNA ligase [Candidatus Kaiserbacteria bacterium RIFCSPLOWO2_02_FULL_45_11b]|uniref:Tryptophan--tRNA ligase n=1 Tax=Candidatus Kaiserbacteria bacterium RIFCSPLOWO2_12_FULL_45_26 TaxID=1798525 RepID=A0A1F6FGX6_9BACT|nr:MAG: tryptophan--tRNA ligase [Candidatus Kaiserbacteria bacterium RIFCSPLOWO2_01_FULL_45_25]OGG81526.1 MAG: tryptophan--tRNA ligase [Candidatus Kaiserbacteria bacterium RIFCSPLOWO2_02_FULL_45_11b]OGG85117.1 MAG: tryptophan--tRNA ligase [Candidatus Kaiserbacteria bacterium RIFCSPLOWO2_12_FULL_45_26]
MKKRILTGLQASGTLHIGNYFGALKPLVDLTNQDDNEVLLMVADYHAITSLKDATELKTNIYNIVRDYLAAGVDPKKVILFRQSDNQDHMELGWIFNCLVTVPFLMQAHSYKDKVAKGLEPNAGLFTYPMLMAADIALYNTDIVPVGEDQRQHIEYTREAVTKFNNAYGKTLKEPKELVVAGVGIVPGTDGQKMSKSYKNTIPLFGTREEIQKAVMSIVTDSSGDRPLNVYNIHHVIYRALGKSQDELDALYHEHAGKYKALKDILVDDIETVIGPMRAKRELITDDEIRAVLADGAIRAKAISNPMIEKIRKAVGIAL